MTRQPNEVRLTWRPNTRGWEHQPTGGQDFWARRERDMRPPDARPKETVVLDYPYVRAWGRYMHQAESATEAEVRRARADRAPSDAFMFGDQGWATFDRLADRANAGNVMAGYLVSKLNEYVDNLQPH